MGVDELKKEFVLSANFLFNVGSPREFHESQTQQQEALAILRHRKLTKVSFERDWPGSRLAPAIDMLKNGWGFEILGHGTQQDPYWLVNRQQSPRMVMTTDRLQAAYYASEHWEAIREQRFRFDNFRCLLCTGSCREELQCHHIRYKLFAEPLDELMTVCVSHHEAMHDKSKLKFPTGMEVWVVERLTGVATYDFPEWLLP